MLNIAENLTQPDNITATVFRVGVIVATATIAIIVADKIIRLLFSRLQKTTAQNSYTKRLATLESLIIHGTNFVLLLALIFMVLDTLGFNIMPLLTGVGLAGLAVSLGSQSIIKDVVSGFFIILENQYNVSDRIKVGNTTGVVKQISLRMTVLEDDDGNTVYVSNSKINSIVVFKRKQKGT